MRRLLWLGVGLAVGALVVRAVSKKAQTYTPRGIAAAAAHSGRNALDSMRDFVDDVRDGMHEREQELHTAFAEGFELTDELEQDFDEVFDATGADSARPTPAARHRSEGKPQ